MKKFTIILLVFLCIGAFALPASAASQENENSHGNAPAVSVTGDTRHQERIQDSPAGTENVTPRETSQSLSRTENAGKGEAKNDTARAEHAGNGKEGNGAPSVTGTGNDRHPQQDDGNTTSWNNTPVRRGWTTNENDVRSAVHALLAMENRTGGIGHNVSEIAREFNNSATSGQLYEYRIQNRDMFSRFFFGGDRDAAGALLDLATQDRERIIRMEDLMNSTTLDPDTRSDMDEQLTVLQQEQVRREQLALHEQQSRGIFG
jgi:hypothetical protein